MRALLRLHTAIVGRVLSQGSCHAFGDLLPRQNRHFVRGNVRWCSTKAGKHKADQVLEAHFEPTTFPAGCDKDAYRRYFQRSKVFVLDGPLKDRLKDIRETIRGLRPDAVVLMPVPPKLTQALDRSPERGRKTHQVVVAYMEAKALPGCTVVCDWLPLNPSRMRLAGIWFKSLIQVDLEKRRKYKAANSTLEKKKENRSVMHILTRDAFPELGVIHTKQELCMAYLLQRTLSERSSEKYQPGLRNGILQTETETETETKNPRVSASKKDKLGPVRIVALVDFDFPRLQGLKTHWQRPVEKERVEEILK